MSANSKIEWTDASWNPIRAFNKENGKLGWACTKPSAGCKGCYAEKMNIRLGTGLPYTHASLSSVNIGINEKALCEPLRWLTPRKVFVCSMTDLFGEFVTDAMLDRVFAIMSQSSQHAFQVLTKRPARALEYIQSGRLDEIDKAGQDFGWCHSNVTGRWPLPNVWLGVSAEDQKAADERIPLLLQTPAAVRFVSYEPALGPVDFTGYLWGPEDLCADCPMDADCECGFKTREKNGHASLSWIIVGGESGPGARPFDVQWALDTVRQCQDAGVACFVKQLGAKPVADERNIRGGVFACEGIKGDDGLNRYTLQLLDRKGGDMSEWPANLRMRQFPEVRCRLK